MRWPHFQHIFFDCDSTLTAVEGIDILARANGKEIEVERLTRAAMDGELDLSEVYAQRLRAINPTKNQIRAVRRHYKKHVVEDAAALIEALQRLGHEVYIVSGGLAEPVVEFGLFLGVPRENIQAVGVSYNELSGQWWENGLSHAGEDRAYMSFQESGLTVSHGKAQIIGELRANRRGRSLLIGDGHSDLLAYSAVDLFVGYGGVVRRLAIETRAPAYVHSRSLAPLLALAAGPTAMAALRTGSLAKFAEKAFKLIMERGAISFQDERLEAKFQQALRAAFKPAR